jgi:glutathione-regulated potassium-efflux system protein KefB
MEGEIAGHAAQGGLGLIHVVALLAAGVVAVPLFRRIGLGSVLGYLAAGIIIGPWGPFHLIADPQTILHAAELGVVMFLFIIGLEMEPSKLWSLRKQIFGLGVIQVVVCGALLTGVGVLLGFSLPVAFVAGLGFVLTSTAIVMQILGERGELATPSGQKMVSILLLEDLAIVPLLAIVAIISPSTGDATGGFVSRLISIGIAVGAILILIVIGRQLLNPIFRFLANSKAREVMTAAALLVVLGAALLFQSSGLSMAMGAFLAGVLLSTSTFRHQLEADVEPFRGILLGLFFLAVGMSLDLGVVASNWLVIALSVVAYVVVKAGAIYVIARALKSDHREAFERAVLMAQGGEFAFVLYTTAVSTGLIDGPTNAIFTATVIISMVLTPFTTIIMTRLLPKPKPSMDGVDEIPDGGLRGDVLIIGFGRFGQIAAQPLFALRHNLSIIDNDTEMIQVAGQFGVKVYYGDGTRLDVLRAAGAATAEMIMVCVDKRDDALRMVEIIKSEFPLAKLYARAFDRPHAFSLIKAGVDYQIREALESALVFGEAAIRELGATDEEAAEVMERVRNRDRERFDAQLLGGLQAGRDLLLSNAEEQAKESGSTAGPSKPIMTTSEEETAKAS